jgi:phosphoenolpyruvate-protein phosphotransferase (PTS system enzyme I)
VTRVLAGTGVGSAAVVAPVHRLADHPIQPPPTRRKKSIEEEVAALEGAALFVQNLLQSRASAAAGEIAEILTALSAFAADPALLMAAKAEINNGWDSPTAISRAAKSFAQMLQSAGGAFAERAADLDEIALRITAYLTNQEWSVEIPSTGRYVLVAEDLTPADTAQIDPKIVVGVITQKGGPTSHTSIICRQMGIAAVVGCTQALELKNGDQVLVDPVGDRVVVDGELSDATAALAIVDPDVPTLIPVYGNIGNEKDAQAVVAMHGAGVGLFRTELLYLDAQTAPTIAEQRKIYEGVFAQLGERPIVIRTLDAGSDKPLKFLNLAVEENPALGVRGWRIAGPQPQVVFDQLTAIKQAADSTGADVRVMAPMISIPQEAHAFAAMAREVGLKHIGIMIETPAIAFAVRDLAGHIDFVSIGTNDLAQYLFAADRQHNELVDFLDPWQPALLRTIKRICDDAKRIKIAVGVCGEAAADPMLAVVLAGIGVNSVSAAAPAIPGVRTRLAHVDFDTAHQAAELAMKAISPTQAKELVRAFLA